MGNRRGTARWSPILLAAAAALAFAVVAGGGAGVAVAQPDDDIEVGDDPSPDESLLGPTTGPTSGPDTPPPDVDGDDGPAPPEPAIDPATAKAMAKKLIAGGDEFFKKGDYYVRRKKPREAAERYERALAAYSKAFELAGNPQIHYLMAQAEDKLARWVNAANHYRRFLADATDADAALHTRAAARLEAIKLQIGVLTLVVQPEGAAIALDGSPLGAAPLAEPLFLAPGEYSLSITADGYQPSEPRLIVEAGSEAERTFELEPVPAVIVDTAPPPPPPPPPPRLPPGPSRVPLILGGAATGVLWGGAAVTGIMATRRHDIFVDDTASVGRRENARTEGKNLAVVTDGLILGGAVAAAITTYYYLEVYKPKRSAWTRRNRERALGAASLEPRALPPKLIVAPWVEGSGAATITGWSLGGAL
jgi:hypothetical protein